MSAELAQRVRYQEGQVLRAADLEREQQYRLEKRWRHNIAHHRWGIVSGLRLEKEGDAIVVQPGMAVDGFGRELFVPEAVCLEPKELDQVGSQVIQVWLVYRRVPVTPPQRGRFDCGPGRHSRWSEEAWLELTPGSPSQPVHSLNPGAVAAADREFGPHQTSPDDPDRAWPVYLGRIELTSANNYEPDMAVDRPYVKLNGQLIVAPSGRAQMQVGNEAANDRRRFAVGVSEPEDADSTEPAAEEGDGESGPTDRFTIDHRGNLSVVHDTTLHAGDLIIVKPPQSTSTSFRRPGSCVDESGETGQLVPSVEFEPLLASPTEAAPWQIYRADVKKGEDEEAPTFHQLRFEVQHPGEKGDPARNQFVFGSADTSKGKNGACLSVTANCTVTVHSALTVEGQMFQGPVGVDPNNPRFGSELMKRWLDGLTTASMHLDAFYNTLEVEISAPPTITGPNATLAYTITVRNLSADVVSPVELRGILAVLKDGNPVAHDGIDCLIDKIATEAKDCAFTFALANQPSGEIAIAVTAIGVGSTTNPVWASAQASVSIVPP